VQHLGRFNHDNPLDPEIFGQAARAIHQQDAEEQHRPQRQGDGNQGVVRGERIERERDHVTVCQRKQQQDDQGRQAKQPGKQALHRFTPGTDCFSSGRTMHKAQAGGPW